MPAVSIAVTAACAQSLVIVDRPGPDGDRREDGIVTGKSGANCARLEQVALDYHKALARAAELPRVTKKCANAVAPR